MGRAGGSGESALIAKGGGGDRGGGIRCVGWRGAGREGQSERETESGLRAEALAKAGARDPESARATKRPRAMAKRRLQRRYR